jgi:hypothetical protein
LGDWKMQEKDIEMDIKDIFLVKESIAEIDHIGRKYDLPAKEIIEKVNKLEKVKV